MIWTYPPQSRLRIYPPQINITSSINTHNKVLRKSGLIYHWNTLWSSEAHVKNILTSISGRQNSKIISLLSFSVFLPTWLSLSLFLSHTHIHTNTSAHVIPIFVLISSRVLNSTQNELTDLFIELYLENKLISTTPKNVFD